ncbi:Hypothetical lipoprotein [Leptospira biflexa serovar Patoc strain 'Patoc 1 (Ames)']|uniref:Lipoprotein n=1 Tax=Leptospira biflexa serovar Patoc (strain Patoc 1 / ATCC 23582 / Paris) TaxID=456481 RepID=B0SMZ7_LEPBP|nr:hypothetical protein [Leptospira biflexa]ABZ93553.1 Hypothetical lipoprotein [Leptospira biflexa serovar Patoc strain 'Patoc 1 (Ames)']ABZ97184.1 Hypothetical protein; putative signal peptide [Leptospira biflexa serovar Patoc strain 'Patoc 1 (Paris)']
MNLMVRLVFSFVFLLCISCNFHYFALANETNTQAPDLDKIAGDKIRFHLIRVEETPKANLYNAPALEFELAKSKLFKLSRSSKLNLTYTTKTGTETAGISALMFLLTLGIFPSFVETHSNVTFTLMDREDKKIFRDYSYPIQGRRIISWLTIPFYIVLPIFSDSVDGGVNYETSNVSLRMLVEVFEADLAKDCLENPELLETLRNKGNESIEL